MNCEQDGVALKGGLLTIQTLCFIVRSVNATPAFTKWLLELLGILEDSREHAGNVSLGSYSALYHTLLHCTGSGCDIRHDLWLGGEAGNGSGDYSPAINITTPAPGERSCCCITRCLHPDTSGPMQHPVSVIRVILPVVTRQFLMMPRHWAMINDGQPGPGDTRPGSIICHTPGPGTLRSVTRGR